MHPDRIAMEGPERALTYAQLSRGGDRGGAALRALGGRLAASGVALELPPGEDYVIALHGCMLAGVAAVPVDLRLLEDERARRRARARRRRLRAAGARRAAPDAVDRRGPTTDRSRWR